MDFPELQAWRSSSITGCMQMVSKPQQFDVLAMLAICTAISSAILAPVRSAAVATHGINVGAGIHVYESFHGGSRETLGVDRANPLPLLLPALDLLEASARHAARDCPCRPVDRGRSRKGSPDAR